MSTTPLVKIDLVEEFDKIIDGPSREELFDSLRLHNLRETLVTFCFRPRDNETAMPIFVRGRILRIELEDGSGQSWNIVFRPTDIVDHDVVPAEPYLPMYYRTDRRSGGIVPARLLAS